MSAASPSLRLRFAYASPTLRRFAFASPPLRRFVCISLRLCLSLVVDFFVDLVVDFSSEREKQEAICSSLEDYNKQIQKLKEDMHDATHGADNIRNDITALAQRYAVVERDEECGVCKRKILTAGGTSLMAKGYTSGGPMAPFYIFPCSHAFHAQCLIAHVARCSSKTHAERILELQKQLSLLGGQPTKDSNAGPSQDSITTMTSADKLRSLFDDAVASECPFCGDLMIREISLPFVRLEEAEELASWEIKPPVTSQKILPMTI